MRCGPAVSQGLHRPEGAGPPRRGARCGRRLRHPARPRRRGGPAPRGGQPVSPGAAPSRAQVPFGQGGLSPQGPLARGPLPAGRRRLRRGRRPLRAAVRLLPGGAADRAGRPGRSRGAIPGLRGPPGGRCPPAGGAGPLPARPGAGEGGRGGPLGRHRRLRRGAHRLALLRRIPLRGGLGGRPCRAGRPGPAHRRDPHRARPRLAAGEPLQASRGAAPVEGPQVRRREPGLRPGDQGERPGARRAGFHPHPARGPGSLLRRCPGTEGRGLGGRRRHPAAGLARRPRPAGGEPCERADAGARVRVARGGREHRHVGADLCSARAGRRDRRLPKAARGLCRGPGGGERGGRPRGPGRQRRGGGGRPLARPGRPGGAVRGPRREAGARGEARRHAAHGRGCQAAPRPVADAHRRARPPRVRARVRGGGVPGRHRRDRGVAGGAPRGAPFPGAAARGGGGGAAQAPGGAGGLRRGAARAAARDRGRPRRRRRDRLPE